MCHADDSNLEKPCRNCDNFVQMRRESCPVNIFMLNLFHYWFLRLENMSEKFTILAVDDDPHIREIVSFALDKVGFNVLTAANGKEALLQFSKSYPDLIVLDILMPELDGTEVCKEIRKTSSVPIIFLSSKDEEIDRIIGLEIGGDDYVTKPFSPRELVARVRAVLRRIDKPLTTNTITAEKTSILEHGMLRLDMDRFEVCWNGEVIVLTSTEFDIIQTLIGYPGKVFSRNELMDAVYGTGVIVSDRTIDSHIRRLRRKFNKIKADLIDTVHGVGYRLRDLP